MQTPAPDVTDFAALAARSTRLAVELVSRGADVVVVGGTARWLRGGERWLRGGERWPADLDVAVTDEHVEALAAALAQIGAAASARALLRGRTVTVRTAWCPVDVFVCAREPAAAPIRVDGLELRVAA